MARAAFKQPEREFSHKVGSTQRMAMGDGKTSDAELGTSTYDPNQLAEYLLSCDLQHLFETERRMSLYLLQSKITTKVQRQID